MVEKFSEKSTEHFTIFNEIWSYVNFKKIRKIQRNVKI